MTKIGLTGVGADPEVFLSKGGVIVSAIGKVGGTKKKPLKLDERGYFVQEDNVLAEFNIPPAATELQFAENIGTGIRLLKLKMGEGYDIVAKASHEMSEEDIKHPKAMAFGCDSDICAWNAEEHVAAPPASTLRTGGGHAHIGYKNPTHEMNFKIAKACDIFLGLPSVMLDEDKRRREVYGGAGHFRHKPYGMEYRTLSSFWINDPILCRWVFRNIQAALAFVESGEVDKLGVYEGYDIITAINFSEKELARLLIGKYNVTMP